jgi:ribosome-binding protein aMBF1 (putative translation factor)
MRIPPNRELYCASTEYRRRVGKAIESARVEFGLTVLELHREFGMDVDCILDLESAVSKAPARMIQLAEYLGVECPEAEARERVA